MRCAHFVAIALIAAHSVAQTPTESVGTQLSLRITPSPSPTPLSAEPAYFPKGRSRRFLDEVRGANLPDDAYRLVTVIGALKRPLDLSHHGHEIHVFTMPPRKSLTVSEAVEAAGGFGDFADTRHVGLWKNESGTFLTIDVRAFLTKEPDSRDPVVEPGDIVVVLQRLM